MQVLDLRHSASEEGVADRGVIERAAPECAIDRWGKQPIQSITSMAICAAECAVYGSDQRVYILILKVLPRF